LFVGAEFGGGEPKDLQLLLDRPATHFRRVTLEPCETEQIYFLIRNLTLRCTLMSMVKRKLISVSILLVLVALLGWGAALLL
jgi:hypothetical protein